MQKLTQQEKVLYDILAFSEDLDQGFDYISCKIIDTVFPQERLVNKQPDPSLPFTHMVGLFLATSIMHRVPQLSTTTKSTTRTFSEKGGHNNFVLERGYLLCFRWLRL